MGLSGRDKNWATTLEECARGQHRVAATAVLLPPAVRLEEWGNAAVSMRHFVKSLHLAPCSGLLAAPLFGGSCFPARPWMWTWLLHSIPHFPLVALTGQWWSKGSWCCRILELCFSQPALPALMTSWEVQPPPALPASSSVCAQPPGLT